MSNQGLLEASIWSAGCMFIPQDYQTVDSTQFLLGSRRARSTVVYRKPEKKKLGESKPYVEDNAYTYFEVNHCREPIAPPENHNRCGTW
jgi:hypothetical protein